MKKYMEEKYLTDEIDKSKDAKQKPVHILK